MEFLALSRNLVADYRVTSDLFVLSGGKMSSSFKAAS